MSLACLKFSLAFILGAVSLVIFVIFQLQTNVIRVHIQQTHQHQRSSMSAAGRHPHEKINDDIHTVLAANGTTSAARDVAAVRSKPRKRDRPRQGLKQSNSIVPLVLLNMSAGETQQKSSSVNRTQHAQVLKHGRDLHRQSKRSINRLWTPSGNTKRSMIPIEEALSHTAPDWVGQTLPPVKLSDIKAECDDGLCMSRLSEREQRQFNWCTGRADYRKRAIGPISSDNFCHFQIGTNRHPVALASLPGSGNTWVRGLLQKITGICTGSLYCDSVLRARGFPGDFIRGPSVIAVKVHGTRGRFTHGQLPSTISNSSLVFGAAILLVRDPRSALVAEWHRERTKWKTNATSSSHSLYTGEKDFKNNKDWNAFVEENGKWWSSHTTGWIISGKDNPFHIVRYEDLKSDLVKEMKKMIDFLGFLHLSEADIAERLGQGYNQFYRNHKDSFGHFTEEQKSFIHKQVVDAISTLKEHGLENVFPIHEYL